MADNTLPSVLTWGRPATCRGTTNFPLADDAEESAERNAQLEEKIAANRRAWTS